jgi:acetyl/propionyl-CoA carboxylase alpha subunit
VEFILNPVTREFFFLEMNTRLQVEHPITEMVTGLDLVKWQIRIAAGEKLPYRQAELNQRGHAIECRLYAEDPSAGFLPATGPLLRFIKPDGPGVRVDSGFTSGDEISIHYDPLIAKVIVLAEERAAAIHKMQTAMRSTVLLGVTTNWQFLIDVLNHPDFSEGQIHTTWVEQTYPDWQPPDCDIPAEVVVAAALTQFHAPMSEQVIQSDRDPFNPWRASSGYRSGE